MGLTEIVTSPAKETSPENSLQDTSAVLNQGTADVTVTEDNANGAILQTKVLMFVLLAQYFHEHELCFKSLDYIYED